MLNQLENLTKSVGGSNNLVGINPRKESYMQLNEKCWMIFVRS